MIERQGGAVAPSSARAASAIQSPRQRRAFPHQSRPMRPRHNTAVGSRFGKQRPATPSRGSIWEEGGGRRKGGDEGGCRVSADLEGPGDFLGDERKGDGVMTMEMIVHQCGRSLIEPSAVSSPMDFLTSEAEYRRVWQVCGSLALTWYFAVASLVDFVWLNIRAFGRLPSTVHMTETATKHNIVFRRANPIRELLCSRCNGSTWSAAVRTTVEVRPCFMSVREGGANEVPFAAC